MISISHFSAVRNGILLIIHGLELLPCPICDGELFCRGTCRRKTQSAFGETTLYQLRVLQCRRCGKTHRELPAPIIPFKRYDAEAIVQIRENPEEMICEPSVRNRIMAWVSWFIVYASHVKESQQLILSIPLPNESGKITASELLRLVRIVANSQNWSHNRTVWTKA